MRLSILVLCAALSACALENFGHPAMDRTALVLQPADAATSLSLGGALTLTRETPRAPPPNGEDPLVLLTLSLPDGRALHFEQANHAPNDLMAQAAGGTLAQVMGFFGQEQPTLYHASEQSPPASPILCAPNGPQNLGLYEAPDGRVTIVGLKTGFEVETLRDGTQQALPMSPDQVCARLNLRRN